MRKGEDYTGIAIVFFCHDGSGRFLMAKRSVNCRDEHGCWDIGSGGLEHGDEVGQTISREVAEEYCTEVLGYDFLGYRDVHRTHNGKKTHWVGLDFKVHVNPDRVAIGEPHKFDALEWFTLDTLPNPLHSQFPRFLEVYKHRLI